MVKFQKKATMENLHCTISLFSGRRERSGHHQPGERRVPPLQPRSGGQLCRRQV